ncbi:MAG: thioredoxin family protein [candidate division Zixibacteria bacterium]|jgi:peroxiredoxin|nr:thioredoxin family protein [candidate division Zixibacteria bacterium]
MRKTTCLLFGAVALSALVGCSAEAGKNDATEKTAAPQETSATPAVATIDQPAPAFTLTDTEGTVHSLSDFKGKYVVLEWINFDCPFVVKHYSSGNMQSLQKKYMESGVVWLTICSSAPGKQGYFEGEELASRMEAEEWMGTAYLADPTGAVGKAYGATNTPHMYVISPEGMLIYAGAIDDTPSTKTADIPTSANYVVAALDAVVAGQPVATKATAAYGCAVKY